MVMGRPNRPLLCAPLSVCLWALTMLDGVDGLWPLGRGGAGQEGSAMKVPRRGHRMEGERSGGREALVEGPRGGVSMLWLVRRSAKDYEFRACSWRRCEPPRGIGLGRGGNHVGVMQGHGGSNGHGWRTAE